MRLIVRIVGYGVVGLLAVAVLAAGAGYMWLSASLPTTEGRFALPGLTAPVEVRRDGDGIVHIRAKNDGDAYFALGFVHAQDRMWQMETMRRLGAGKLAQIAGRRSLPQDILVRTLGLYRMARKSFEALGPETRAALSAYARGVNAWIGHRDAALPPPFTFAGIEPEPWKPADSLVWGRLMAINLSGNWRTEAARARLSSALPLDRLAALWPAYPADAPVTIADNDRRAARPPRKPSPHANATRGLAPMFGALIDALPAAPPSRTASNTWVLSGARTESGKPILANDPHLALRAPNLFYLARITTPEWSVAGATVPGVPFHIVGHNGTIAWGLTTTGADTQDLVVERLDPGNPERYVTPSGTRPMVSRMETIQVRGAGRVRLEVRETQNGPVVSGRFGRVDGVAPKGHVLALRSAALQADDRTADALFRVNRARNWKEFRGALALFGSPVQNVAYADTAGHIGMQTAGRVPVRRQGDGAVPVNGADPRFAWTGVVPFDAMPRILDPPSGAIVNANNRIWDRSAPLIARDWEQPYRAMRLMDMLAAKPRFSMKDATAMQLDLVSYAARELVPRLIAATSRNDRIAPALDRLARWDRRVTLDAAEPLILNGWVREAISAMVGDDLGALAAAYQRRDPLFLIHVLDEDPAWCDDVTTEETKEGCGELLAGALARVLDYLESRLGPDAAAWRWGDLHVARFANRSYDWIPYLGPLTDIAIPTPGDNFTINRGTSRPTRRGGPFAHVHGAVLRAVFDLADPDRSGFIQPMGQSEHPLSPHYRDLTQRWRDGVMVRLPAAPGAAKYLLTLVPGP